MDQPELDQPELNPIITVHFSSDRMIHRCLGLTAVAAIGLPDHEVPTIQIGIKISLSTIVLNRRDWSKIVWILEISCFKNQPRNRLYPKKPTGMHWLGYNDPVSWLNEMKTQIFQPTANFEIFEIYLYFVCLPACCKTRLC